MGAGGLRLIRGVGVGSVIHAPVFIIMLLLLLDECKRRYKCKNVPRLLSMINFYK